MTVHIFMTYEIFIIYRKTHVAEFTNKCNTQPNQLSVQYLYAFTIKISSDIAVPQRQCNAV